MTQNMSMRVVYYFIEFAFLGPLCGILFQIELLKQRLSGELKVINDVHT